MHTDFRFKNNAFNEVIMIDMFLFRHANQHKKNRWSEISSWVARDILETMYDTQEQAKLAYS